MNPIEEEYIDSYDGREGCLIIAAAFGVLCLGAAFVGILVMIIKLFTNG
jgi:tetrahydromethanopterin S-methyltransferase subunit B